MITELVVAIMVVSGPKIAKSVMTKKAIRADFERVMKELNIKNHSGETYRISKVYVKDYGFFCTVAIPKGLGIEKLEAATKVLEVNMKALVEVENSRFENFATVKLITDIKERDFQPEETASFQLFLGYKIDGSKLFLNLNHDPHILIAGRTGTGKSFLLASILTNLLYHNSKHFELYLLQIKKGEIDCFRDCKGVRSVSLTKGEVLQALQKATEIIDRRSREFTAAGIRNFTQWNEHFKSRRMKRVLFAAEEISFLMEKPAEGENPFFKYFNELVKAGRSVGVHFIGVTQRTTATNLGGNGELKSQLSVITGTQRSAQDSINAIDIGDATKLKNAEYILYGNGGYTMFTAPRIDEDFHLLQSFVPEIRTPQKKEDTAKDSFLSYEESEKLKVYDDHISVEVIKPVVDAEYTEEPKVKTTVEPAAEKLTGVMTLEDFLNVSGKG